MLSIGWSAEWQGVALCDIYWNFLFEKHSMFNALVIANNEPVSFSSFIRQLAYRVV